MMSPGLQCNASHIASSVEKRIPLRLSLIHIFGIAPDIEVKLTDEQTQNFFFLTSETDPQLQKAMETVG